MTDKALTIYSGRLRPDLTPIYKLFEGLTGIKASVEMIYHLDVEQRIKAERADPQGDLLLTNSQVAVEAVRESGVFEPYQAEVGHGQPANTARPKDVADAIRGLRIAGASGKGIHLDGERGDHGLAGQRAPCREG